MPPAPGAGVVAAAGGVVTACGASGALDEHAPIAKHSIHRTVGRAKFVIPLNS
jgi:hypothetical protein